MRPGTVMASWQAVALAVALAAGTCGAAGTSDAGTSDAGTSNAGTGATGAASGGMDANGQLQDAALQTRYERITHALRCLVCQNESIADSNVDLAGDLRRQVREMLIAHESDDAIFKFMTDRYGEFVRFAPPLEPKTLLIWGAPFIMMLLGSFIVVRIARQRAHMPIDE